MFVPLRLPPSYHARTDGEMARIARRTLFLIIWNAVVNRIWHVDRYGGKMRTRTDRTPGGFGWEGLRQAWPSTLRSLLRPPAGTTRLGTSSRPRLVRPEPIFVGFALSPARQLLPR